MIAVKVDELKKEFGLSDEQIEDLRRLAKQAESAAFKDPAHTEGYQEGRCERRQDKANDCFGRANEPRHSDR